MDIDVGQQHGSDIHLVGRSMNLGIPTSMATFICPRTENMRGWMTATRRQFSSQFNFGGIEDATDVAIGSPRLHENWTFGRYICGSGKR